MTTSDSAADHAAGSVAPPGLAPVTSPRACRHIARRVSGQRGAAHATTSESRTTEIPDGRDLDTGAFDVEPRAGAFDSRTVCGERGPRYRGSDPPRSAHVGDPGELIAALPALVGFAPQRSLVVAVLRAGMPHGERSVIEALARFDLAPETRRRARVSMFTACIAQICAVEQAREVLVIVVDDRLSGPAVASVAGEEGADTDAAGTDADGAGAGGSRRTSFDADADALIASLEKRLGRRGIEIGGGWAVRGIAAGARWWSLFDREQRGEVPDPTASPVSLAHVLEGRPIHRSRAELTALVEADTVRQGEVAVLLPTALAMARDRFTGAVTHGDLDGYRRNALEFVLWQIAHVESGAVPTVPEIAELVAALRDRAVRDTMFALAVGDHAAAAESLWLTLVRALSGSDRAEVAALLGYSAYIRGDGPFAGIALDAALLADPFHPMAILLETSLRAGMRPEALRRLARSGYDTAACLGIELGPAVR
ncbi:DUF4192 domain-containing protein [Nocardia sp. NBC_01377]|uniref:DUF4192 domain-containing protein n=1 Tax=Nocardia sp. NBC_01377 TaxID=2903595 RepID=UPI00324645D2